MKVTKSLLFLLAMLFCFVVFGAGPTLAAGLPWAMISLPSDDGFYSPDQQAAIDKMNADGIPGTFCIVTDYVGDGSHFSWSNLKLLENTGHEICNHTKSHLDPDKNTTSTFINQVSAAETAFRQHGLLQVSSFAIPFGSGYNLVKGNVVLNAPLLNGLNSLGYITTSRQAFTGDNSTVFNDVATFNPMAIKVFSWKGSTPESYIISIIDQANVGKFWLVLVFHVVAQHPDASDDDQISLDMFKRVCDHIALLASQGKILPTTISRGAGNMIFYKNQ